MINQDALPVDVNVVLCLGEIYTDLCQRKNCGNCDIYAQEAKDEQFDTPI